MICYENSPRHLAVLSKRGCPYFRGRFAFQRPQVMSSGLIPVIGVPVLCIVFVRYRPHSLYSPAQTVAKRSCIKDLIHIRTRSGYRFDTGFLWHLSVNVTGYVRGIITIPSVRCLHTRVLKAFTIKLSLAPRFPNTGGIEWVSEWVLTLLTSARCQ